MPSNLFLVSFLGILLHIVYVVVILMIFFFFCLFLPAAADVPIDRSARLRVGLMEDQITFAADAADKLKNLVGKAKGQLSKLYSQIFPRLDQVSGLEVLTGAFGAHHQNP